LKIHPKLFFNAPAKETLKNSSSKIQLQDCLMRFLFVIKKSILGIVYLVIGPAQWVVNRLVKKVVHTFGDRQLLPAFFETTQNALEWERLTSMRSIYLLRKKLETLNSSLAEALPGINAAESSLNQQSQMKNLVLNFKQSIFKKPMNDPVSLHEYFNTSSLP